MIMDLVVEMMVNGWRRRFQVVKGFAEYYVAKAKEVLRRIAKSFCAGPSSEMIVIDLGNRSRYFHQSHSCLPRWSLKTCRVLPPQDAINICWQNNTESISKVILPEPSSRSSFPLCCGKLHGVWRPWPALWACSSQVADTNHHLCTATSYSTLTGRWRTCASPVDNTGKTIIFPCNHCWLGVRPIALRCFYSSYKNFSSELFQTLCQKESSRWSL